MINMIGGGGSVQANNCAGIVPTGNCNSNVLWSPPNGNWWTWGATGVPVSNCANTGDFDFAGGSTDTLTAVTVSTVAVGANAWQNCNCGAFNCYTNCNCNCNCACNGGGCCFLPGAIVLMADGSRTPIAEIRVGDVVQGRWQRNMVVALERPKLGRRPFASINGELYTTTDHTIWTRRGFAPVSREDYYTYDVNQIVPLIDNSGNEWEEVYPGLPPDLVHQLRVGDLVAGTGGSWHDVRHISVTQGLFPADLQLYGLKLDGDHTYSVDNYFVGGWPVGDYDYRARIGT